LDSSPSATFNVALKDGYTMTASATGDDNIAGSTRLSDNGKTVSFVPAEKLPAGKTISVTIAGLESTEGSTLAPVTWTFTTLSADGEPSSFLGSTIPENLTPNDSSQIELGLRLKTSKDIEVSAIRYYRASDAVGQHTGSLWSSGGQRLAAVTFPATTTSGWQTAPLEEPVLLPAGTVFTVSYFAPQGGYVSTAGGLGQTAAVGALTIEGNNGVYRYGDGSTMPDSSWNSTNYFADLIYRTIEAATPPSPTTSPEPSAEPSPSETQIPATSTSTTPAVSQSATTSPPQTSSAPVSESASPTNSPAPPPALPENAKSVFGMPPVDAAVTDDGNSVELGMGFSVTSPVSARGVAFYKSAVNTGQHTGYLYAADGTLLASVPFNDETPSGWEFAAFDTPVVLEPGDYTVSYLVPGGGYNYAPDFKWGSLPAAAVVPSPWNGRYAYGSGGTIPTGSWNNTNYFVDVIYTGD